MPFWRRTVWGLLGVALVFVGTLLGLWTPADARLQDWRFETVSRAPSGDVVLVDIDAITLQAVGTWPWPRSIHARILDNLLALGAYEVAFDIDFSLASSAAEDAALEKSLEAAGGYAYLAAFTQADATGGTILNKPLPQFARHAKPVLVNVNPLEGGLVRSLPARSPADGIDALPLALNPSKPIADDIRIDFGIDLAGVPRISALDILEGTIEPALVRDKQVVVGASAIELHDLFAVPRFGIIPGALVQIAAVETVKQDRTLHSAGLWPLALVAASMLCLLLLSPGMAIFRLAWALLGLSALAEIAALVALAFARLEVPTMPIHVAALVIIALRLAEELMLRRRQVSAQRARIAYMARHDLTTGALTEAAFAEAVDGILEDGAAGRVVMFRFSRVGTIGASLGYEVAEAAMRQAYGRLFHRVSGPIGRLNEDSLVAFLPGDLDQPAIASIAAALDKVCEIGAHRVMLDAMWSVSSALGPDNGAAQGIQNVRTAMAASRHAGSKGMVHSVGQDVDLHYRQALDTSLRGAVDRNEFFLLFQPQIDLKTSGMVGLEALLRWNSPDHGLISPATFIPLAEENGTIVEIGAWVMAEACRQASAFGWTGQLSVNVSPVQFREGNVLRMVTEAAAASGFPLTRLDIEITEGLFMESGQIIVDELEALRSHGVGIAIDDFGTGYASLSYLDRLPVDKLKIDQGFVRRLDSRRGADVITAIVALGNMLGHHVIAEGVETLAEAEQLLTIGCHTGQGYLYSRPVPLNELLGKTMAA